MGIHFALVAILLTTSAVVTAAEAVRPVTLGCADTFVVPTHIGIVSNNAWNSRVAAGSSSRQCVQSRRVDGHDEYGWAWQWPPAGDALLSFPQVVRGWRPWQGGTSSQADLPLRISSVGKLRLAYDVETHATGKYNLATTLWITRSGTVGPEPDPHDISTDLMIWTDGFAFDPFGSKTDQVSIDGIEYEIWRAAGLGDASGKGPRWDYVAYRATAPRSAVSLDLRKILEHAVTAGFVSAEHYVSNVEVGNEIMSGAGETWIRQLTLEVVPQ